MGAGCRIAYLLLCHKNPEQINRLCVELTRGNADVYIHLDKKQNHLRDMISVSDRISLVSYEDSYVVEWGFYSICEAILKLIETAKNSGREYDYYALLSGQDFPLVSQQQIERFLADSQGANYISIMDASDPLYKSFDKRNELRTPAFLLASNSFARGIKKIYYTVAYLPLLSRLFLRKPLFERYYYGNAWWCLSRECIEEMLSIFDGDPQIARFYRGSSCPDESMFHTLFMQTAFADTRRDYLTYVDWSEHKRNPKTLTSADYDSLLKAEHGKLFARKFDINVDREIIDMICRRIKTE